ncbi:MAG: GntR family transcriptional regulator [Chloroflexi bacterium]|nr:GntR family transcriptional regulator [Chloroflexota bacterium]
MSVLNLAGLPEQIAEAVRERIVAGQYRPGERLNIDRLASDLGVSTTPVREGLARLVTERLVCFAANKGYRVMPPPDAAWLDDLFDVRLLLETYGVRLGAARRDPAVLRRLEEILQQMEALDPCDAAGRRAFVGLDRDFHTTLVDSAGNRVLAEEYTLLSCQLELALVRIAAYIDLAKALQEHAAIVGAYCLGDRRAAEEALRTHLLAAEQRVANARPLRFGTAVRG